MTTLKYRDPATGEFVQIDGLAGAVAVSGVLEVAVSADPPTEPSVQVWIDTDAVAVPGTASNVVVSEEPPPAPTVGLIWIPV